MDFLLSRSLSLILAPILSSKPGVWFIVAVLIALVLFLTGRFFISNNWFGGWQIIGETVSGRLFWTAVMVGFFAQVVDGALGMAYGVTATTFLLATGATPGVASASVHIAEIFTTGVSGTPMPNSAM